MKYLIGLWAYVMLCTFLWSLCVVSVCGDVYETSNHHLEPPEPYDTLTQSDIVQKQYMTLPYPAVSQGELKNQKTYYDKIYHTGIRKIPYSVSYGVSFEALNHFLYKGRNTFRLALKWYFDKS